MARHVIVNLLHPFSEGILFHFEMEPPAETELFHYKSISRWNILFHTELISSQHGTIVETLSRTCSEIQRRRTRRLSLVWRACSRLSINVVVNHRQGQGKTVLSLSAVWTEWATSQDCRLQKTSKLFCPVSKCDVSCLDPVSNLQLHVYRTCLQTRSHRRQDWTKLFSLLYI